MNPPTLLVVIGGGEHGRVVIDAARSRPDLWTVLGFLDTERCDETVARLTVPRLGADDAAEEIARVGEARFVVGIGALGKPQLRADVVARFTAWGTKWATVIHRDATVSPTAIVGEGSVVFAGAVVNTGAHIGSHCVVNTSAIIEHDVVVGDYTQVAPAAAIGGGATIGYGSYVALGSRVRDHVRIGNRVVVAMGAAVVRDVDDDAEVAGVPARPRTANV